MILAFDAKRFTHNGTGLGNYSRFLLKALAETYPEHDYRLYTPSLGRPDLYRPLMAHSRLRLCTPQSAWSRSLQSVWRSVGMLSEAERGGADIFHGLSNELPYSIHRKIPTLLTVHDLIYVRYPEFYKTIDRWIYKRKYRKSAERADRIVAISQATKRDLVDFFDIQPDKIEVVYQGCDPSFAQVCDADVPRVRELYDLPSDYILFVGSIEDRKNLALIVEALSMMPLSDLHLVAIGRYTPYSDLVREKVRKLHLEDRVHIYHSIPFTHLPAIYRGAQVFCYPSKFEGFGIPIVEALSCGIPVVAATGSCLREAGGPAQFYTDPEDPAMLATLLEAAVCDTSKREDMIRGGREHIQAFLPQRIASDMMAVYRSLL